MKFSTKVLYYCYLFCFVFSFYIVIPTSMLMVVPLFFCVCSSKTWLNEFLRIWGTKFVFRSFVFLLFICTLTFLYTIVFLQFDWSLLEIFYTQIIHFICATFFFTFLSVNKISFNEICDSFVNVFVVQTFIQIICSMVPVLGNFVRFFNHYDTDSVIGLGSRVRGFALSAATTYHLSLVYGVAFIIYIKRFIECEKVTFVKLLQGCLIVIGIFFAGRTGFVGVGIACLYFLLTFHNKITKKLIAIFKLAILLSVVISSFLLFAPKGLRVMVIDNLIPYAFEFVYSKLDSGKAETASTNQLKNMWKRDFEEMELVIGSGKYVNSNGSYYMKVDPGVLRHLLYGGILFYFFLLLYQCELSFPYKKSKKYKDYFIFPLIFIYFLFMDFKGVTIAVNKFAFSVSLLFSFSYLNLEHSRKIGGGTEVV